MLIEYMGETYNVTTSPREFIRLSGTYKNHVDGPQTFDITFHVGDQAIYDTYNLKYTGEIVSIGNKTVTIAAYKGTNNETRHRLNLGKFAWKNWNFNAEKVFEHNAEELRCL